MDAGECAGCMVVRGMSTPAERKPLAYAQALSFKRQATSVTCALKMAMPVGAMPRRFMQMLLLQVSPCSHTACQFPERRITEQQRNAMFTARHELQMRHPSQ